MDCVCNHDENIHGELLMGSNEKGYTLYPQFCMVNDCSCTQFKVKK